METIQDNFFKKSTFEHIAIILKNTKIEDICWSKKEGKPEKYSLQSQINSLLFFRKKSEFITEVAY